MVPRHFCVLLLAACCIHTTLSATLEVREGPIAELQPINEALELNLAGENAPEENPRDKRLAIIKKVGIKAVLLNHIFNKIDGFLDHKTRLVIQLDKQNVIKNEKYFGITTPKPTSRPSRPSGGGSLTTDAPIVFSTNSPVSLSIPDQLYGNSFGLVTNISQTIGDVLFNTAGRAQEFSSRISEKVRRQFGFTTNLLGSTNSKSSKS